MTSSRAEGVEACDCCRGDGGVQTLYNRPGLPMIRYRIGTHSTFFRSMIAQLPKQTVESTPSGSEGEIPAADGSMELRPLVRLTTRDRRDLAIALLDAWATVADVLTFYQERIANECLLQTATERRSVLELARAIGYELKPGVAAGAYLAFRVEPSPGAPKRATIPKGTRVQSIPSQGSMPQSFETTEALEARLEHNDMRPARAHAIRPPQRKEVRIWLKGTQTGLKPGDGILIVGEEREGEKGNENWDFRRVSKATPVTAENPEDSYTIVEWEKGLGWKRPVKQDGKWVVREILPAQKGVKVYAFRQRAALFGHNAPDWIVMPKEVQSAYLKKHEKKTSKDWPGFALESDEVINLDAVYSDIAPKSWVVLSHPTWEELYRVEAVEEESVTDFTLTGKTTQLKLSGEKLLAKFRTRRRDTVVYARPVLLPRFGEPLGGTVEDSTVVLDRVVDRLVPGQMVAAIVSDERTGEFLSEVVPIARVEADDAGGVPDTETPARTKLVFERPLAHPYDRSKLVFNANVVAATHGETVADEVVGEGRAEEPNQRFRLRRKRLTYVSAPTERGVESSLEVRVGDVRWQEVSSLLDAAASDRVYETQTDDDGVTSMIFGDGEHGARLPSGSENVKAAYRVGIGLDGEVEARSLSLMQNRPYGIRDVLNPLKATGAAEPEALAAARENAPRTVLTLGRIVSLEDFADFASTFPGVGKAQAMVLWTGENQLVHLTVATESGSSLRRDSVVYANLSEGIDTVREPTQPVRIDGHAPVAFRVKARITMNPDYREDRVLAEGRAALLKAFSFARRDFGQPVTSAEVVRVLQEVGGVVAVALARLSRVDLFGQGGADVASILPARVARWEGKDIHAAELLLVDSTDIELEVEP